MLHPLNLTHLCPSRSPNPAPSPLAQVPTLNPSLSQAPATLSSTCQPEWPFFFFNSFGVCNLYYNHLFSLCLLQTMNPPGQVSRSVSPSSSVAQSCPTLCDPVDRSTPGLPVHPGACSLNTVSIEKSTPGPALSIQPGRVQGVEARMLETKPPFTGLPWLSSGWESILWCRGCRFDPWLGN